jgi:hypothetical protein
MLETHQTTSELAHAYVETLAKSIKLTKTSPETQPKHKKRPENSPPSAFSYPGGGT